MAEDREALAADRPELRVTLVHGTWGRGPVRLGRWRENGADAAWCAPGSAFRRGLERGLLSRGVAVEIATLRWSGANSILERDRVAGRLADDLERQDRPGVREVVIGHSHGGSVALRAIELLASRGSRLPSVATIATPFLSVEEGSLWRARSWSRWLVTLFLTAWCYINLVLAVGPVPRVGVAILLKYGALPLICVVAYLVVGLLTVGPPGWAELVARAARVRPRDADFRLLVVRGMEDEAGMALSLGLLGVRLSDLLSYLTNFLWVSIAAVGMLALASLIPLGLVAGGGFLLTGAPPRWASALLDAFEANLPRYYDVAWWMGLLAGLTLLVPGLFKITFGRELLLGSGTLAVTAHSVPDVAVSVTVETLGRARQGNALLLHSLYDHDECCTRICEWIVPRAAAPVAAPDGARRPRFRQRDYMDEIRSLPSPPS